MNALQKLPLLVLATAAAGCDTAASPDFEGLEDSFRSARAKIVVVKAAGIGEPTALALEGKFDGPVVWTVLDHPPDPGAEAVGDHPPDPGAEAVGDHPPDPGAQACLAGIGPEGFFVPTVPGTYVLRALVLEPDSLEVSYAVDTKVFIEGRDSKRECVAEAVPSGILPSIDEVAGIEPTPFHGEVSGIDPTPFHEDVAGVEPTPFAVLYEDGTSVSAGCLCAYE